MHRASWASALALTLLIATSAAPAEAQDRPLIFGVGGGVSFVVGDLADEFDPGFHLNGLVQANQVGSLPFGLRGEVGFQRFSHDDDSLRHILGRLNAVVPFAVAADAAPYFIAGLGVYNSEETSDHGDHAHDRAETFFGVNAGAGIRWRLGGLNTFVEARFHHVFDDEHAQQFIPLSVGILF